MDFPTTESPVSQIIEKLDSLPNSARDAAVNNSIVLLDNLGGFGESVLKLYSESNRPPARLSQRCSNWSATNRSTIGLTGSNAAAMDSPSKKRSYGNSIRLPKRLPTPSIRKDGLSPTMTYAISDIWKSSGKQTLPVTISYSPSTWRGKDMDSASDWMSAVRDLVYSWDPVEGALIAAGCPDAPSVDRIIEDFKSTYESSISGIEAVCQIVTSAWDEKAATDDIHSESLDQICEHVSDAIDESASICVDMQLDSGVVR